MPDFHFVRTPSHFLRLLILAFSYLLAMTYPFQWNPFNHAKLEENRASFSGNGILRSSVPLDWLSDVIEQGTFSVDLRVTPLRIEQEGPARILTISENTSARNLTVGQEGSDLILRLKRSDWTANGTPPFVVPNAFNEPGARDIRVTVQGRTLELWLDGALALRETLPERPLAQWDSALPLALGNELTLERPWLGEINVARLATPSQTINLLSPEVLDRPLVPKSFALIPPSGSDMMLNFGAFALIGILTLTCLSRPSPLLVALGWMPVCVGAESLQLFFLGRDPSVWDFSLNVIGAFVGGYVALFVARELQGISSHTREVPRHGSARSSIGKTFASFRSWCRQPSE